MYNLTESISSLFKVILKLLAYGKVRITVFSDISSTIISTFIFNASIVEIKKINFNNTGIEYEIKNDCGRNIGTDGNSNFTLPSS